MFWIILSIWLASGLALWAYYKLFQSAKCDPLADDLPPQCTLVGAMMWPFYLGEYLASKVATLLGIRKPPASDE